MAIANANAVYSGGGPAKAGQIVADRNAGDGARSLRGTATATGDASSTSFIVNYVDGTETLPFTPTGIICSRTGGAATATIGVIGVSSITTTGFTVTATTTINAATFVVAFEILK